MKNAACPRCGKTAAVEELAPAGSDAEWLRCGGCDHVWQRPGTESDAFSLIVGSRLANAQPVPAQRPPRESLRALRFQVKLPVRFRAVGDSTWQTGTTVNISQTGIFVRVQRPVAPSTDVEILLELAVEEGEVRFVRCSGRAVRSVPPIRPGAYASLAVAVNEYRIGTEAPPRV